MKIMKLLGLMVSFSLIIVSILPINSYANTVLGESIFPVGEVVMGKVPDISGARGKA